MKKNLNEEISRIKSMMRMINEDEYHPQDQPEMEGNGPKYSVGDYVWDENVGEKFPGPILKVYKNVMDAHDSGEDMSWEIERKDNEEVSSFFNDPVYLHKSKGEHEIIVPEKYLHPSDMNPDDEENDEYDNDGFSPDIDDDGYVPHEYHVRAKEWGGMDI